MLEESKGMGVDSAKPRLGFGKTLANYEELAEGLEQIEKQLLSIETHILGQREPTDIQTPNRKSDGDRSEPGYIERFDDIAIRMRSSVLTLSNIASRLNGGL